MAKEARTPFPISAGEFGFSEQEVLHYALQEDRRLVTFDKNFGELVYRPGAVASCGIIIFRITQSFTPGSGRVHNS